MAGTGDLERGSRYQGRGYLRICDGDNRGAYEKSFSRKSLNLSLFKKVYTGRAPFPRKVKNAVFNIVFGTRPELPDMPDYDELWRIIELCWDKEPEKRPTTSQLLETFRVL